MKTIFTLLTSLFMSAAVFAADARTASTLTVKSNSTGDIRVVLDGKKFEPNDNAVILANMESGNHSVKVYRQSSRGFFNIMNRRYELVYNSILSIRKSTNTTLTIDRNGNSAIQEAKINRGRGRNDDGYNDNGYNDDNRFDTDRDGQWGDYDSHEGYSAAMSDREFRSVLSSIDREWLESNKLKSATQVVRSNNISTAQVKQLMQLFSFENNKLDVAKQAYANTVDKKNYRDLYECFSFATSRNELERFTRYGR